MNVLIILSDQQRYDTVACAGYPYMVTPNLDSLASEGCLFTHAYSGNPVCMPARHDLLLGMPSKSHGYFKNASKPLLDYGIPTLPGIFTDAGFRTCAVGKMHFFPARAHHGYGEMFLMEELPNVRQDDQYAMSLKENGFERIENIHGVRPLLYHEMQQSQVEGSLYETEWVADRAVKWLRENGDSPFFLCCGFIKPHPPWDIPEKWRNVYDDKTIPESIPRSRLWPENPEEDWWYGDKDTKDARIAIRKAYYTAVTMVDDAVGKIISYLKQSGKLDDTLVIFTSDHGEMLQDKGYYSKELPYEGAVRIPLIARLPGRFASGSRIDSPVTLTDIMPTCLAAAGLEYPKGDYRMEGFDLAGSQRRSYAISASGYPSADRFVMCTDTKLKYIYRYNRGCEELYNLISDPGETVNIIEDSSFSGYIAESRKRVTKYEAQWGPEGCIVDGRLSSFDGELNHGSVHGKYHLWSNFQFQRFTELKGEERKKEFMAELEKALGGTVPSCLSEPQWMNCFMKEFDKYGKE